jgi:hypothetical protein
MMLTKIGGRIEGKGYYMEQGLCIPNFDRNEIAAKEASIIERLIVKRDALQKQLEEINETIETMEKYPEFEKCLSQLSRAGIYR